VKFKVDPLLWELGVIAPWFLYSYQEPVFDFIERTQDSFFEATRRFGKTTTRLALVQERSRRQEGRVTRWCEPWKDQARKIVIPEMDRMQESCPPRLKARFYRTDSFYEFPATGSRLYLMGVNEDRGESARGSFANEIVADEVGSWVDAEYIINEVLRPQLLTTRGELPMMSTPPFDLGHFWYQEKARAIAENRFIQATFDSITTLSAQEKQEFIEAMGGKDSAAVRRELYCEPVADPESLVIPEFREGVHVVPNDYPRPAYFDAYSGADLGFNDSTAILFGYWDFVNRELVIEDEMIVSGKNSEQIVSGARAKEVALWGGSRTESTWELGTHPYRRVSDNDLQQIHDMGTMLGYWMMPTRKDDKLAAINGLRMRFGQGKLKIKERCRGLIYQLKVGLWNDRRTDFLRSDHTGHLDAVAALVYLSRNIDEHRNPFPQYGPDVSIYTHHVPDHSLGSQKRSPEEEALSGLLGFAG
jgi:hypothetical protein